MLIDLLILSRAVAAWPSNFNSKTDKRHKEYVNKILFCRENKEKQVFVFRKNSLQVLEPVTYFNVSRTEFLF